MRSDRFDFDVLLALLAIALYVAIFAWLFLAGAGQVAGETLADSRPGSPMRAVVMFAVLVGFVLACERRGGRSAGFDH